MVFMNVLVGEKLMPFEIDAQLGLANVTYRQFRWLGGVVKIDTDNRLLRPQDDQSLHKERLSRERARCLTLGTLGLSYKAQAEVLEISPRTARQRCEEAYAALGASGIWQAIGTAFGRTNFFTVTTPLPDPPEFVPMENIILARASFGSTLGEIGEAISLSEHTIKTHCKAMYDKLNVNNMQGALVLRNMTTPNWLQSASVEDFTRFD